MARTRIPELSRPDPERLLKQVQAEENKRWGARLKIFLGYSTGVGKSYRMLDEARRRHERGEDVVVGAVQDRQPEDVQVLLSKLESVPLLRDSQTSPTGMRYRSLGRAKSRRKSKCSSMGGRAGTLARWDFCPDER